MDDNAVDAELLAEALNLEVEEMRAAYDSGNTDVLIEAIRFCGRWKLVHAGMDRDRIPPAHK